MDIVKEGREHANAIRETRHVRSSDMIHNLCDKIEQLEIQAKGKYMPCAICGELNTPEHHENHDLKDKIEQLAIVASGHKELSELMEKRWHEVSAESMERGDLIRQLEKEIKLMREVVQAGKPFMAYALNSSCPATVVFKYKEALSKLEDEL